MLLLLLAGQSLAAQSYIPRWQYSWGGNRQDMIHTMIPRPGNQYFFGATAASDISCTKTSQGYGDEDFVALLFDDNGNKLWEKSYGGDRWDQLRDAISVPSGGYILTGETQSGPSGIKTSANNGVSDIWVVRIDDNGNLLWEKSYGGIDIESGVKIIGTPDGGWLIGGMSLSNIPNYNNGRSDYLLLKIDANGNQLWSKLYGGTGRDELYGMVAGSDGNYFLCGTSDSPVSGNKTANALGAEDIWLVKVDPNGNKLWDKSYGTAAGDYRGNLVALQDGNILLVESSVNTGRIRKVDINGNQLWVSACQGNDQDFFEVATEDPATGNLYVAGTSKSNNAGCKTSPYIGGGWFSDIWLAVFDGNGNKLDDLDYGGNDADIPTHIDIVNNEIWISAWSDSPLSGNKTTNNCGQTADGWILRLAKKFYINSKTPAALCLSQTNSKLHFTTSFTYDPGNLFTVQLSDEKGSFAQAVNIGSLFGVQTDSIAVSLPANLPAGSGYRLRVITNAPADTTAPYPLWIHGLPALNLGNDTLICAGSTLLLSTGSQPPGSAYTWQDNSHAAAFSVNSAGAYWCRIDNGCGSIADSISVSSKALPLVSLGKDTSFCAGSSIVLQSSSGNPGASFLWNTGSNSPGISIDKAGLYWLEASNSCGKSRDSLNAALIPLPQPVLDKTSVICKGSTHLLDAGNGYSGYTWSNGASTQTINVNNAGTYWVQVKNSNGCTNADTVIISRIAELPASFLPGIDSICSYEKKQLSPAQSYKTYLWNDGSTGRSASISKAGTYWLQVTDNNNCSGRDSITIYSKQCIAGFYVPTAFSPNQDGRNDYFKPIIGGIAVNYQFTIYNRWGQIIFSSRDPLQGWDGRMNGKEPEKGIYIWTCQYQLEGMDRRSEKGTVLLIR